MKRALFLVMWILVLLLIILGGLVALGEQAESQEPEPTPTPQLLYFPIIYNENSPPPRPPSRQ